MLRRPTLGLAELGTWAQRQHRTLTNLGSGSRGGTRGCSGELTSMGSWEVSGKQVLLKNRDGSTVGTLYKTADSRFDGSTASGQPLSLSR